ncbi:uncharacterized protein LOC141638460 [Silene latifolia]|uniref:uncharacterized protein LOC141638460 n=1 Tax=Silene latifolia TaxID=37657 RepID=UPI003D7738E3
MWCLCEHNAAFCMAENDEVYAFRLRGRASHSSVVVPPHLPYQRGYHKPPFVWPPQQQTLPPVEENEGAAELKSMLKALTLQMQESDKSREAHLKLLESQVAQLAAELDYSDSEMEYAVFPVSSLSHERLELSSDDEDIYDSKIEGDFNQVDYQEDKWGGSKGRIPGAALFNKWKAEHLLMDIPYKGPRFTWCNKREDHSVVLERLDKGYGSWDWNDIFPNSHITHLPIQISDHAPIIFETDLITCNGRRPYRMEAWNLDYEECIRLVHNQWTEPVSGSATVRMIRKLSRARNCMRLWSISKRKEWNKKWSDFDDNLVEGLHEIETKGVTRTLTTAYASQVEYAKVSAKYWKQRAKMKWNTEGDTCSKYFFNWVKGRAGRNYIAGIKMDNGKWNFDSEGIKGLFVQFYFRLFQEGANQITFDEYRPTVKNLFSINKEFLSPDDRDALCIRFTPKEVRTAVFQLGPLKSPGHDGIPAIFFHKCWHFIKHDVIGTALAILNGNSSPDFLNKTFLVLIPKSSAPETVDNFRPIILCNVIMKVITRYITNRLKKYMGKLVGDFQNAFVPGRNIGDNILITNEILHKISSSRSGRMGRMAFKADMSKAYDRLVELYRGTLLLMGFP